MASVRPPRRPTGPRPLASSAYVIAAVIGGMGWLFVFMLADFGQRPAGTAQCISPLVILGPLALPLSWLAFGIAAARDWHQRRHPERAGYSALMYRHPSLRPLSRGHQPILMHARDLRWRARSIDRGDMDQHIHAFLDYRTYAESHLEEHLRAEETHLLPRLTGIEDNELRAALHEYTAGCIALREAVASVVEETPDGLRRLGDALEHHARRCERALFPAAERVLDDIALAEVATGIGAYKI